MTIKIGFPDIPKRTVKLTHTDTWGDSIRRQDFINNISGPRYSIASMQSSKTGLSRSSYDLGETTAAVDHLVIGRADLLQADDVKSVRLRGSRQSAFLPSSISGLKLWLDANRGVTTVSGAVSQWDDLSGNGNNATQGTAANRPFLTNYDNRENAASYNNTLSNAAWNKTTYPVSAVDNFTTDYLGESIAAKITATAGTTRHGVVNASNKLRVAVGEQYLVSIDVKKSNFNYVWVGDQSDSPWHGVNFNLNTGAYIGNGGNVTAKSSQSLGSGWYRLTLTFTSVDGHFPSCGVWFGSAADDTSPPSIAAVGTEEVYICGAQIRRASADDYYLATPADAVLAGINSNRSIMFDGSNDYLLANALSSVFTGTDKAISAFFVYTPSKASTVSLASFGRSSSATPYIVWRQDGNYTLITRDDAATTKNQSTGTPGVLQTVWSHVSNGTAGTDYINGSLVGSAGYDINLGARTLDQFTLGAFNRTTLADYFQGYISEILIFDSALSTDNRQAVEQYLTDKWTLSPTVKTHTLSTDTLTNNDLVLEPSATSSAYRHWWLEMESDAASKFTHSKIFFGQWLDMGETIEDVRVIKGLDLSGTFITDSGSRKLSKGKQPRYQIEITWSGLSDTVVKSFAENVTAQMLLNNSFYLYAGTNSDQLNGNSLLYCKLIEWSFPTKEKADYNTIRATFEGIE